VAASQVPRCKETNYFTRRPPRLWSAAESLFRRRLNVPAPAHTLSTRYACLFRKGGLAGEASVDYMDLDPGAVRNVSAVVGRDTKIIALLRDPVDRVVSQFVGRVTQARRHERAMTCADFVGAAFAEQWGPVAPLARSDYAARLRRWVAAFGGGNVLVVQQETLAVNATWALGRVLAFLGLDGRVPPPGPPGRRSRASHHLASADPAEVAARESCDRAAIRRALEPRVRDLRHFLGAELPRANAVALRPWYYA